MVRDSAYIQNEPGDGNESIQRLQSRKLLNTNAAHDQEAQKPGRIIIAAPKTSSFAIEDN